MSLVLEQLGEPAVRDMYDRVLLPLFVWRYEKFDIDKHPWDQALETLMLVACEAMRGHLVGPERTGDMELIELGVRRPNHEAEVSAIFIAELTQTQCKRWERRIKKVRRPGW